MKLRDYLKHEEMTAAEFARRVGASEHGVTKWLYGQRMPRRDMLAKIEEKTDGKVTANDFVGAA